MIAVLFILYKTTFSENSLQIKPTYDDLSWHEERVETKQRSIK